MQSLELQIGEDIRFIQKAAKHPFNRYATIKLEPHITFEDCYNSFLDSIHALVENAVNKTKETVAILRSTEYLIGLAPKTVPVERTHVSSGGLGTPVPYTDAFNLTMMLVADQIILPEDIFYSVPEMPNARMEPLLDLRMSQKEREMLTVQLLHTALPAAVHSSFWGPVDASQYATA
ncbi:hypothetical protein SPFM12_00298 [Salmonella phage SPFM12]|nr:hypothetical protein SPFM12_00298 [Salmonella phage SPFM12]